MRQFIVIVALVGLVAAAPATAREKRYYEVIVTDPYVDMHTGPGGGYPKFHVVERGEQVEVLKRRTDWFKVRTEKGVKGWVNARALARTVQPDGRPTKIVNPDLEDYYGRRREMGLTVGDFDGADIISTYLSWLFTPNLSLEVWGSRITGDSSNGWMANVNIVHTAFPDWRIQPFATLGTGVIRIDPKSTLVGTEDRTDQEGHAGLGLRAHISRRFLLRAEYKSYVVFTSRDDNEEVSQWSAGFSFFF
jgi:SH3-like domain-containing protein